MHITKTKLLLSAALFVTNYSTVAAGQSQPGTTVTPSTPMVEEASPAASASGDIVVTARRRSESINSVPISITAFNQGSLTAKGVVQVEDLQRITPGLKLTPTAGRSSNSQFELRGISTTESLITEDPAVGIYINDVYRARATGTNQSFFDIENVQVLYGPQGTLFGRNSSAGAILINTQKPVDRYEGEIEAGYGSLNRYEATAILNVPVSDKLAFRFAGQRVRSDGYVTNITSGNKLGGQSTWSGRASMLYKPTDAIGNSTVVTYFKGDNGASPNEILAYRPCPTDPSAPRPAASCSPLGPLLAAALVQQKALGPYRVANDPSLRDFSSGSLENIPDGYERPKNISVSNTTTIQLTDTLLAKNIFGYNYESLRSSLDLDGTAIKLIDTYYDTHASQVSEEVQLQGQVPHLNWVAGALYFRESGLDIQNSVQNVVAATHQNLRGINTSYAAFAQGTYKILDKLSFTAGGRYTIDRREAQYNDPQTQIGAGAAFCTFPASLAPTCELAVSKTFKQPTYTVSIDYKPSAQTLFYVAHRLGYRSGGFNSRVATTTVGLEPFKPETVKDVEVGFKGSVGLGGEARLHTSVALYDAWYKNIQRQVNILTGLVAPATTTSIVNAADANVKGLEFNGGVTLVRGFDLSGFVGYVDGKYGTFASGGILYHNVPFAASKLSAGLTASLTPVDDSKIGRITYAATYSFRSPYYGDNSLPILEPESRVPSQQNINLTVNWDKIGGSPFSIEGFVRNATNETHILGVLAVATAFGITPGVIGLPRTYGFIVKYKF